MNLNLGGEGGGSLVIAYCLLLEEWLGPGEVISDHHACSDLYIQTLCACLIYKMPHSRSMGTVNDPAVCCGYFLKIRCNISRFFM